MRLDWSLSADSCTRSADVAGEMRETWRRRREEEAAQQQPHFKPVLTARGRQRVGRTPEEMSEGDRLRCEFHKAILLCDSCSWVVRSSEIEGVGEAMHMKLLLQVWTLKFGKGDAEGEVQKSDADRENTIMRNDTNA